MTDKTSWPYDAAQDDPLTALRIPAIPSIYPDVDYLIALCINDDPETPLFHGLRPDDGEAALLQSVIGYIRGQYREGYVAQQFDPKPYDVDPGRNTITFIKRGENDWAYRHDTWTIGPVLVPALHLGQEPLGLRALLDKINSWGADGAVSPKWAAWQASHPDVFPEPTAPVWGEA